MNLTKDYYTILGITKNSTEKEIKKAYYNLSKIYHPDKNKESNPKIFTDIVEAYSILGSDKKREYDLKSKYGSSYSEFNELYNINIDYDYKSTKSNYEKFKRNDVDDIYINVDDNFDGTVEYERWVKCKACDGTGKDLSAKIIFRDEHGNITKIIEGDDGCDFCDGTGKDYKGETCSFCHGKGKIGITPCKVCKGEKRILGKQKLSNIKLIGELTKIEAMGHISKNICGKIGSLFIRKK
ncbi:MAG: DnaJ domain-containing protein [Candidatus Muirbacterium halophilum]|nr:DnaJ domain-containing protein [Candidatus Muirbacterium halophilum]